MLVLQLTLLGIKYSAPTVSILVLPLLEMLFQLPFYSGSLFVCFGILNILVLSAKRIMFAMSDTIARLFLVFILLFSSANIAIVALSNYFPNQCALEFIFPACKLLACINFGNFASISIDRLFYLLLNCFLSYCDKLVSSYIQINSFNLLAHSNCQPI